MSDHATRRAALVAALAIGGLFAGSLALVRWTTAPAPAADPPASPAAPAPATAASEPPPERPAPPARSDAGAGAGPARASWSASGDDPAATPLATRVVRMVVRKALLAAPTQARLARCVDRDGGFGGLEGAGRVPRAQPSALTLELELGPGQVRIVEAQVRSWGGASPQTIDCARAVLRGQVIAAELGEGTRRVQMPFPLSPRSESRAEARGKAPASTATSRRGG